jgi:hypothetical protein
VTKKRVKKKTGKKEDRNKLAHFDTPQLVDEPPRLRPWWSGSSKNPEYKVHIGL